MGCIRLCRSHVFRRMLQRVRIHRQAVHARVRVISGRPRLDVVEQPLTRVTTSGPSTFRAAYREFSREVIHREIRRSGSQILWCSL
jgi:hypothetical protein